MFCLKNKFFRSLSLANCLVFILLMTLSINTLHAANNEQQKREQQAVDIKAQYLLFDEKKGISKYKGNVFFKKGTLSIKADTVTLYYIDKKLSKALIIGSPADVLHYPDNEAKVHSQANEMEFFITEERLILKGQAFVDQGNRHFSGEHIEYDTRQRTITAAGSQNSTVNTKNSKNNQSTGRVHVIIGPIEDVDNVKDTDNSKNIEQNKN
jgi:lipopolysaccharide export system protein LptA